MKPFSSFALLGLLCAGLLPADAAWKAEHRLASPDGALSFFLERDDTTQSLAWSVTRKDQPVVTRGALGLELTGFGVIGGKGPVAQGRPGRRTRAGNPSAANTQNIATSSTN